MHSGIWLPFKGGRVRSPNFGQQPLVPGAGSGFEEPGGNQPGAKWWNPGVPRRPCIVCGPRPFGDRSVQIGAKQGNGID